MARRQRSILSGAWLLCLGLGLWASAQAQEPLPHPELQPAMRTLFQALTHLVPWSLDPQAFQEQARRQRILEALHTLASQAATLETHGQQDPQPFDFLRRSLAQKARTAAQRYSQGDFQDASLVLRQLTEHCFACHARFTQPQAFPLGKRFLEATPLTQLSLRDRVRLAVATRQFDTALETCEAVLRSETLTAPMIDVLGVLEDYLKIVLRVRHDFPRARTALERFVQRSDVPFYMRERLTNWIEALQELASEGFSGEALPRARALIEAGQRRNRFPADQQGLVHFVVASSLLQRYIDAPAAQPSALAEAYYLLGLAEAYVGRTSWVSETPFLLETAIRLQPTSATASKAYSALRDYLVTQYTGSSGTHIPPEIQANLDELRRLLGGS
ncbi:MAG: hypothetical protein AB7N91_13550 [Candidatus Tectimicrobiota bacterium]